MLPISSRESNAGRMCLVELIHEGSKKLTCAIYYGRNDEFWDKAGIGICKLPKIISRCFKKIQVDLSRIEELVA